MLNNIIKMKYEFKDNNYTNVQLVKSPKDGFINEFSSFNNEFYQTCIRQASTMEADSSDKTYYMYFLDDKDIYVFEELEWVDIADAIEGT